MQTLQRINAWMTPRMPLLIVIMLALGVLFPGQVGLLCPYVTALMIFQTFANSLGAGISDLLRALRHPKPVLLTLAALHVLMPLIALGIGSVLFPDQPFYTLSLVLEEASPAAVSSLMWIVIGGGNVELCLSIILLDTVLSPIVLPMTLRLLCGSAVSLDIAGMMKDLLIMVVVPAATAMVLHRILGKDVCTRMKARISVFPKFALLLLIGANVTRCVPFLRQLDGTLVVLTVLTLFMRILGLAVGWSISRLAKFPYSGKLTVTVNSSMRNNAAAATLAAQYFPPEAVFSPSISPMFSQLCVSVAVKLLMRHQPRQS